MWFKASVISLKCTYRFNVLKPHQPHPKSLSKREGLENAGETNSLSFGEGWGEALKNKPWIYTGKNSILQ